MYAVEKYVKNVFCIKKYIQYSLVIMWEHCKHVSDDGVLHLYVNYVKRKLNIGNYRENSRDWCKKLCTHIYLNREELI